MVILSLDRMNGIDRSANPVLILAPLLYVMSNMTLNDIWGASGKRSDTGQR